MRTVIIALPLTLLFGCAHKAETKKDAPPTTPVASATVPAAQVPTCNGDVDCKDRQICVRGRCEDISDSMAECNQLRVHFALNSSDIDQSDRNSLERSARCLKADHALHVTVEGNADERGTEEYNLALGDRRATAVAKYMEALGASSAQLKTVSYGKEKPLCTEHDEDCWAKNRRAEVSANVAPQKKKRARTQ